MADGLKFFANRRRFPAVLDAPNYIRRDQACAQSGADRRISAEPSFGPRIDAGAGAVVPDQGLREIMRAQLLCFSSRHVLRSARLGHQ
jgi:hypothetical protein